MLSLKHSFLLPLLNHSLKFASFLCGALIIGLRPLLGPAVCKFEPTCTKFALQQLSTLPLHKAVWAIIQRLLLCSPFT